MEMDLNVLMLITLLGMLLAIFAGVHIALALGATAMIGTYFIFEDAYMAASQVGGAAYELIRDHVFMTIPLFVLMGDFLSRSGAAADLYNLINKGLKGVPGRLGVATVTGNTAFAAVTGTSIASAAAFTRIAWPEMKKAGYNHSFALGAISGSACLGMLIPPSVLLSVWGIITEDSIGKLFVAVFAMFFIETYALVDLDLYIIPLMCIMCVAIPFVLVTIAPRFIPAEEVNLFFLLETIIGPFWVWMVIKEQPSIETITGGAVIIFTIAIHSFIKLKNS